MKEQRLIRMEQFISERGAVSITELCEKYNVHINTIRSDINELVKRGIVDKTYGGVKLRSYQLPTSYSERSTVSLNAKKIIGSLAASLLEEDDVIYADSGTTVSMMFSDPECLPKRLTVLSNNLSVINWCAQNTDYNVYVLPGRLERMTNSLASLETIDSFRSYNVNKIFLGVRGLSASGGLTSASPIDAKIKAAALELSAAKILLASADKIGHPAMINFASVDAIDIWVSDFASDEAQKFSEKYHIQLITPDTDR